MGTLLIMLSIAAVGAITKVIIMDEIKTELLKVEAKIKASMEGNYEQVSHDVAGLTSKLIEFDNNKYMQLRSYISKEVETVNRQNARLENLVLELDKQNVDNLEQLKKGLSIEVKTEAMNTFNHYMLWERLSRLKEMENIRKGALR